MTPRGEPEDGNDGEVAARLRQVIVRTFDLPQEAAAGRLEMGHPPAWDSLGHMSLVMAIEREFGLRFATYEVAELSSLEAIARTIAARERE